MSFLDYFRPSTSSYNGPTHAHTSEAGRARRNGAYTLLTTTELRHESSASADLVLSKQTSEKATLKAGGYGSPKQSSTLEELKSQRQKSTGDPCTDFDIKPTNLNGKFSLGGHAAAEGGFANVYRGILEENGVRKTVAVKIIR